MSVLSDLHIADEWRAAFPGAAIGLLELQRVSNPTAHPALDAARRTLESDLRGRYAGFTRSDLRALPVLHAYDRYYRRFDKSYHVQLQLESVTIKGKPIASVSSLVETMFMAELKHHLLTAIHDADTLVPRLSIGYARDATAYTLANGRDGALRPGDMYMADAEGVICSIIYGQDARTRVTPATTSALYVVYAPPGIDAALIDDHFDDITRWVRLVSPDAVVEQSTVVRAS